MALAEPHPQMDRKLMKAATSGDSTSMQAMASHDPSILLGRTPRGNTCLHISSIHGHQGLCNDVLDLEERLLTTVNFEKETPLIAAVTYGHVSLALFQLSRCCSQPELRQAILQEDKLGFNALHHAIRNGHEDLALELIAAEPALSQAENKYGESPMFIAAMRDFTHVFLRLIEIPDSPHRGMYGSHALHAAARNGNQVVARKIMETRPHLAREADYSTITPIRMAVLYNKVDVLRVLLEHDSSLAYEINECGSPLLYSAAARGQVDVARELLYNCPDAFHCALNREGFTCLHIAVRNSYPEFTEFIVRTPQLWNLINMRDGEGKTALRHHAVKQCDPRLVVALLSHKSIDIAVLDRNGRSAASQLLDMADDDKTLDWKEVHMLMSKADPKDDDISSSVISKVAKQRNNFQSRKERMSLTQKYTNNMSLVAILLATITFTAAFILPGGYSSDAGSAGLPIMSRKIAFQAFLISDTLAMCSSFVVAFICLMGKWEDDKFTSYYISVTKKLTWFAYMTTITAFSTGLYTVLSTQLHWLAIGICSLIASLPILTMLIGQWPVLRLNFRSFRRTLLVWMLKFWFCPNCLVLRRKFWLCLSSCLLKFGIRLPEVPSEKPRHGLTSTNCIIALLSDTNYF